MASGGTHLFLYHSVLDTIDNLITDIDKVTIMFVIPKPHELPGLQLFAPTALDDPLIVLIACSFPSGFVTAALVTRTSGFRGAEPELTLPTRHPRRPSDRETSTHQILSHLDTRIEETKAWT